MKRLLTGLLLMLVAALPARADLPLLDGNLEVQGYAPEASAEMSAELLLQLPEQIDGWAPVPLHLKVLSTGVESIRLLTDEPEPLELARFELGAGVRPDLQARYHSSGESGILVQVRTAERLLSARRSYRTVAAFAAPEPAAAPAVAGRTGAAFECEPGCAGGDLGAARGHVAVGRSGSAPGAVMAAGASGGWFRAG